MIIQILETFPLQLYNVFVNILSPLYCLSVFWTLDLRARVKREREERVLEIPFRFPTLRSFRSRAPGVSAPEARAADPGTSVQSVRFLETIAIPPPLSEMMALPSEGSRK